MAILIVAAKANAARLLPALLAATLLSQKRAEKPIKVQLSDVVELSSKGDVLRLQAHDGSSYRDAEVLRHLVDDLTVLSESPRLYVRVSSTGIATI